MNINKSMLGFFLFFLLPFDGLIAQTFSEVGKAHLLIKSYGVNLRNCSKTMQNCSVTVSQNTGCLASPGSVTITNNSSITAQNIAAFSSDPNFINYIIQNNGCPTQLAPGASCVITFYTNTAIAFTLSNVRVQGSNTNATYFDINAVLCQTVLTPSVSSLALSVLGAGALTGNPRQITISNTGAHPVTGLTVTPPSWSAAGTTLSSNCPSTLALSGSCIINVIPGVTATSNCNTGIVPTPDVITVSASDASSLSLNILVLNYGCIYQSGYIYSIDDTTSNTGSIGGKVIAQLDQATQNINGIVWSSDGTNSTTVNYTAILGIDESSTVGAPSPISPPYPVGTPAYQACNGATDGSCDSSNIISYYNYNVSTGFPPTPLSYYAAGLCQQLTIGGYTDWYLPSICEMGPDSGNNICTSPPLSSLEQNIGTNLLILFNGCSGQQCLVGSYWGSTESSGTGSSTNAWNNAYNSGISNQAQTSKSAFYGVRCVRPLIP